MKKTIFILITIFLIYYIIGVASEEIIKIPDEAIRFRVIANSNSTQDQDVKYKVKDEVESYMASILQNVDNIDESRAIISTNLDNISNKVTNVFNRNNYKLNYVVNFGLNYFPEKEFKGITYDEGYYESLVITIGEGKGNNWWCVLFPPLCMLEAEESTDVEYKSFLKEIVDKYI
mgnify:CR=1 FL=1